MKITDRSDLPASGLGSTQGVSANRGKTGTSRGSAASGTDQAELSSLGSALAAAAEGRSPERAARLEQLRLDVQQGRYRVDAAGTARSIVNEALAEGKGAGG